MKEKSSLVATSLEILAFLDSRALRHSTIGVRHILGTATALPGREGHLSFSMAADADAILALADSESSLMLVRPGAFDALEGHFAGDIIAVADPRREFARTVTKFSRGERSRTIHRSAHIDPSARIGRNVSIGPGAYVATEVVIGDDCVIGPNAVLLEGTRLGESSVVGPSSTIGYVGFGYAREDDGQPLLVPHTGGVEIGSFVEIGANTCIDRGTIEDTVLEDYVKVDNLVHIAHNCHVGEGAFVIATSILCGGVQIGPRAWIAPNSSLKEHVSVGADAVVGLAAVVLRDVPDGAVVFGNPAREVPR